MHCNAIGCWELATRTAVGGGVSDATSRTAWPDVDSQCRELAVEVRVNATKAETLEAVRAAYQAKTGHFGIFSRQCEKAERLMICVRNLRGDFGAEATVLNSEGSAGRVRYSNSFSFRYPPIRAEQ